MSSAGGSSDATAEIDVVHPTSVDIAVDGGSDATAPPWSRPEGTLMAAARAVRRAYDQCLAEAGVNLAEASVLAHLGDGGSLTQVQLARRIGTSRARIGAHVDSLQAKGALERQDHPTDRRAWMVRLTPAGEALWTQTIDVDRRVRGQLRAGTTPDERALLDELLTRIQRSAESLLEELAATTRTGRGM